MFSKLILLKSNSCFLSENISQKQDKNFHQSKWNSWFFRIKSGTCSYQSLFSCRCKSSVGSVQDVIEEDKTTPLRRNINSFAHIKWLHQWHLFYTHQLCVFLLSFIWLNPFHFLLPSFFRMFLVHLRIFKLFLWRYKKDNIVKLICQSTSPAVLYYILSCLVWLVFCSTSSQASLTCNILLDAHQFWCYRVKG